MLTQQTQGFKAWVLIGGLAIPALPGAALRNGRNLRYPAILSNYAQWNRGKGFRNPIADINLVVRDAPGETLSSAFLAYLLGRSNDRAYDTSSIPGGVVYWDGFDGFILHGAKFDSLGITVASDGDIGMQARFCGSNNESDGSVPPSIPAVEPISVAPTEPVFSRAEILRFASCRFALNGSSTPDFWRFGAHYGNQHSPDLGMDGSVYPVDQNAGMPMCSAQLSSQVATVIPEDSNEIDMSIVGVTGTRTFTFPSCDDQDPDSRQISLPRIMRDHPFVVVPTNPKTIPLIISGSGF